MEFDSDFMIPLSIETFTFDINQANLGQPQWIPKYNFMSTYGLKDLSPQSLFTFAQKIKLDPKLASSYKAKKYEGIPGKTTRPCDDYCASHLFCQLTATEIYQFKNCLGGLEIDLIRDPGNGIFNLLTNAWIKQVKVDDD